MFDTENMGKIKKKAKKSPLFSWYPAVVSGQPKKVISVIIVITLMMGFFASGMDMETEEESFQPDSPKQEYMSTVRERFGRVEESVQIAFTADDGDVFTVEVMEDMLRMERALQEDEKVNRTLASTSEVPTGVTTLSSNVLLANRSLEIERFVIQQAEATHSSAQSQRRMYRYMNSSLLLNMALMEAFMDNETIEPGLLGANQTLISMSDIVSQPTSWMVMQQYEEGFNDLLQRVPPDSNLSHEELVAYLEGWLEDMEAEEAPALDPFLVLVDGTRYMLDYMLEAEEDYSEEMNLARTMLLTFFGIPEPMEHLQDMDMENLIQEPPSLQLSQDEKEEELANMTDEDVKRTVHDVIDHDMSDLNRSVKKGTNLTEQAEEGLGHLNQMEVVLNDTIEQYEEFGLDWEAKNLEKGYLASVINNQSTVTSSEEKYAEAEAMFEASLRLGPMLEQMGSMIEPMVSRDFSPTDELHSIRAETTLGMAFMDPELDREKRLEAQKRIIEIGDEVTEHSETRVSATQVMMEEINESADRSLQTLLPIALVLVIVILFIVFRSVLETVLSLGSLAIAIVWTFGFGVILDYKFNPMIIAVPILITGLVIDYGIHMIMRYREEKGEGYGPKASTRIAIGTVGGALVLTTFTTAVGFLSNTLSDIGAMQQFGILAAVGIISSFFLMTGFLPAVLQLFDERREKKSKDSESKRKRADKKTIQERSTISRFLSTSADAADRYPPVVLIVVVLFTLASIYGTLNIDSTFNIEDFLPEDQPQSQNIKFISENFNVTTSYAYVLTEGELDSPEYLYALNETRENIRDDEMVGENGGDVRSPLTVLQNYGTAPLGSPEYNRTIVQRFSESDHTDDGIPNENVTELYDMLIEFDQSRDSIDGVLYRTPEGDYTMGIIRLTEDEDKITSDLDNAAVLEEELEEDVIPLRETGFTAKITSSSMIGQETTSELTATQIRSLIATILIVAASLTVVFYFLHRSLLLGVITTAPVAVITLWIIGTMYAVGVSLNVMTVSITALTVGMGVDYSIHITHRFTEELSDSDLYETVHETVQNTGAALFGSATTTVAAFAILSTSDILPISQFGYITALALSYSFLAAVFILPSALMLWAKYARKYGG
ncbi:MAG: efflux RND transporter permease subunit [Candidatus Aenigmatarchaeota archaeon]